MFSKNNLDMNYTTKMLNMMVKISKNKISKFRNENVQKYVSGLKKKPTYDKKLMNQKISPTSKSAARPFKRLSENRTNDKWDLHNILNELDND